MNEFKRLRAVGDDEAHDLFVSVSSSVVGRNSMSTVRLSDQKRDGKVRKVKNGSSSLMTRGLLLTTTEEVKFELAG